MSKRIFTRVSDGAIVGDSEAIDADGCVRPGYSMRVSMMMMDGASARATSILRDAAGQPVTLHDLATGGSMKLNSDLIAAIEAEAAKLGMSVTDYVQSVLKYSWHAAKLSGSQSPESPAAKKVA